MAPRNTVAERKWKFFAERRSPRNFSTLGTIPAAAAIGGGPALADVAAAAAAAAVSAPVAAPAPRRPRLGGAGAPASDATVESTFVPPSVRTLDVVPPSGFDESPPRLRRGGLGGFGAAGGVRGRGLSRGGGIWVPRRLLRTRPPHLRA